MTETLIVENDTNIVRLLDETDNDLDNNETTRLIIKSNNNINLEVKYPNLSNELRLMKKNQLKILKINIKENHLKKLSQNNNKLCETLLGFYPNIAFDPKLNQFKIFIQGFLPNGILSRQTYLRIGDLILKINNINVDASNFESILISITKEQTLKLVFVEPLTFLNTQDILFESNLHKQMSLKTSIKIISASKSVTVVKGDRAKINDHHLNEEVFYMVMILSLNKKILKDGDGNEMNDLVYVYPRNEKESQESANNLIDLFVTIRGLFMTLAVAVKEINKNDQAICCMMEHKQQIFNICFLTGNAYGPNGLMIFLVPSEHIELNYFKTISKNLNELFQFTFGNQIDKLFFTKNETENKIKTKMDQFFSQLKHPLNMSSIYNLFLRNENSTQSTQQQKQYLAAKMTNQNRICIYSEMKSKFINQIPYLELPYDLKTFLDMSLGSVEAQEMNDLETNYFKSRRQLSIVGCCMFYRDYLIISHLNDKITKNIYNYVNHYGFFLLSRSGSANQYHIWKEINLNNFQFESRHYLVVTGLKEFIVCMVLEAGGFNSRKVTKYAEIEPNPLYIQLSTCLLNDLINNGIMTEINRAFKFGSRQIIHNINKFFKDYKITDQRQESNSKSQRKKSTSPFRLSFQPKAIESKKNKSKKTESNASGGHRALSQSPSRSKTLIQNKESLDSSDIENEPDEKENDNEQDEILHNDNLYHTNKYDKQKMAMSIFRNKDNDTQVMNPDTMPRFFNDVSLNESIIFYASNEMSSNSILFTPKQYYLDSNLFTKVFYNFSQACFKIKNLLDDITLNKYSGRDSIQDSVNLVEQGCLFSLLVDEANFKETLSLKPTAPLSTNINVKKEKFKKITFWVVGRRKFKINNDGLKSLGDLYVCFHDSVDQVLLELAFDVGFGKHSF